MNEKNTSKLDGGNNMAKIKNKDWYKSKTVWAAVFSAGVAVLSAIYGSTDVLVTSLIAVGSALGIYGRFKAVVPLK